MHMLKSWIGRARLTVSKSLCIQNVKWKPTLSANFYAKLKFGSVFTSVQLIPSSRNKHRPEPSAVPISRNPWNVAVLWFQPIALWRVASHCAMTWNAVLRYGVTCDGMVYAHIRPNYKMNNRKTEKSEWMRCITIKTFIRKQGNKETIYYNNQNIQFGRVKSTVTSLYKNLSFQANYVGIWVDISET